MISKVGTILPWDARKPTSYWLLAVFLFLCLVLGLSIARLEPVLAMGTIFFLLALLTAVRYPIIALAVFFNGIAYYFYAMFKLNLMPSTLVTGMVYATTVCGGIIGLLLKDGQRPRATAADLALALFFLWVGVSFLTITHAANDWAVTKLSYAPVLALAPLLAGRLMTISKFSKFVDVVLVVSKILALIFLFEYLTTEQTAGRFSLFSFGPNKIDNPILVGITFSMPLVILYAKLSEKELGVTPINVIWMGVFLFLTLVAVSRGAIISTVVSIATYHILKKATSRGAMILIFLSVATVFLINFLPSRTLDAFSSTTVLNDTNSGVRRLFVWNVAFDSFLQSPIFGSGFGEFEGSVLSLGFSGYGFAHNVFLETASELGLIGLVPLAVGLGLPLLRAIKVHSSIGSSKVGSAFRLCLILFVYSLIEAQMSGFITNQSYLFLMLGVLISVTTHPVRSTIAMKNSRRA